MAPRHDTPTNDYAANMNPRVVALLMCIPLVVSGACGGGRGDEPATGEPELVSVDADADAGDYDYDYVIPDGTSVRLDLGEEVEIVPQELDVKVGERIRIVNEDSRGAAVGIFWVPANRTVAMEFTSPGSLTGACDVHPSGEFTINVTDL
ncbi:MAG: hypothetical protein ACK5O2_04805 [Microthrixaceae bacterium]